VCLPIPKLASRFTCAAFDSDDLATLDGFEVSEASGHERDEVFQEDGFTTENNDRNLPISEVLLVFKSAIHGQENVEPRGLGCSQKLTVLKSREASIPGGLTFVPGEVVAQSFAHTLVEEDAHSCPGRQQLLSFFQCGDGHLA
jgi:hypothetical protein